MIDRIVNKLADLETYLNLIPFVLGIFLKILLDLNLGKRFVKWFYWASLRSIFRSKTNKISGIYKQHWDISDNSNYPRVSDRHSLVTLKQLSNYCYGEFQAKCGAERYYLFGEIIDRKIIGHWSSLDSTLDYFGSFELTVVSSKRIEGIWIGHSNTEPTKINQYNWSFNAVTPNYRFLVPLQLKILFKMKKKAKKKKAT